MTTGKTHHVKVSLVNESNETESLEFIAKIDPKSSYERGIQNPYVPRTNTAPARSESDFGQYMISTQRSWTQGEGQLLMTSEGANRYYTSNDIDISGSNAGLTLLKDVTKISGGASQPAFINSIVFMESAWDGIWVTFAAADGDVDVWRYDSEAGAWDGGAALWSGRAAETPSAIVPAKGYVFISFASGIARSEATTKDWSVDWGTDNDVVTMGSDGDLLYYAKNLTIAGAPYCHFYSIAPHGVGGAGASCSGDMEGSCISIKSHAGTMFAIATTAQAEQSYLYRLDPSTGVFVLWKVMPDGFRGITLRSDGSVLYIGGRQKCAEGNYRGQIYYTVGASVSDPLGIIATFGERDGTSDYIITNLRAHGKSLYFPWNFYGGLGRYDAVNTGISRSYRQTAQVAEANYIERISVSRGDVFFTITGTNTTTDIGSLWKTQSTTFVDDGNIQLSFVDFGYPANPKLYPALTITTTNELGAANSGTVKLGIALNGVPTFIDLGDIEDIASSTWTDGRIWIYNIPLTRSIANGLSNDTIPGLQAYSLACELTLTSNTGNTAAPQIKHVSLGALPQLLAPGKDRADRYWKLSLVGAKNQANLDNRIETTKFMTKLVVLREWVETGRPMILEVIGEASPAYSAVVAMGEISYGKARDGYEANDSLEPTVPMELIEIGG